MSQLKALISFRSLTKVQKDCCSIIFWSSDIVIALSYMNQNNLGTPSYSFNRRPARESIVYQNNLAICPRLLCPASVGSVPGDAFSEASRNFVTTHGFEYYHRQPPQSSWPTPPPSVVPSESEPFHESSPDFEALHGNTASLSNAQMVMAQADGGNLVRREIPS